MRSPFGHRGASRALLVCLTLPLGASASSADVLEVGAGARSWAPSFSFLANQASVEESSAPPAAAPQSELAVGAPVCAATASAICLTPLAGVSAVAATASTAAVPAEPHGNGSPIAPAERVAASQSVSGAGGAQTVVAQASLSASHAAASPAREPEARRDETELWVPSLSFYSGALIQDATSTVDSSPVLGFPGFWSCPMPGVNECLRQRHPFSGDDRQVTPFVTASLELMTPAIQIVPGRPRAFAHVDLSAAFALTRNIVREGIPGEIGFPPTDKVVTAPPSVWTGQGSETSSYVDTFVFGGGLGVAFTVDVGERRIRIKPSVEVFRETIVAEGIVNQLVLDPRDFPLPLIDPDPDADPEGKRFSPCLRSGEGCRAISVKGSANDDFWGVGPGLEIEMDAARTGPMVFSLYTSGAAYRMLGDLDVTFSGANEFGETGFWSYEMDKWAFRAGVGVRVRVAPLD